MSDTPTPETDAFSNNKFHDRAHELTELYNFTMGLERKFQDAVKRMEQVTIHDLNITFRKGGAICGLQCDALEAVRARLIQAAKGEPS
jgi:hypothetical protein